MGVEIGVVDAGTASSGHQMTPMAVSVCITPAAPSPVPMPYPVTGSSGEGVMAAAMRTKMNGANIITVGGGLSSCHGNEPGTLKETCSFNTSGPCFIVAGAPNVFTELGMQGITGSPGFLNKGAAGGVRTAPVPNLPAPPGMCPGALVAGGGTDGGGDGGNGDGGDDANNGNGDEDGEGASGDEKDGGCAEGDPICPITGRMFLKIYDFGFAGPLPLRFLRNYSSQSSALDGEFGFGWSHTYGWRVHVRRREVVVQDGEARRQVFHEPLSVAEPIKNRLGWVLSCEGDGLSLRVPNEGLTYRFGPAAAGGWHHLVSVTDRNGNAVVIHRDEKGRLLSMTDSAGRPIRFETDEKGRVRKAFVATEPTHAQWMELASYTYDAEGNLASVTDAEGYTANYAYKHHLMTEHRSVSGLSYFYRYDGVTPDARCVESWGEYVGEVDPALAEPIPARPAGVDRRTPKGINHVRLSYFARQRYTEVYNSLGGLTRYFGDNLGRAVKIVAPTGGITERVFDNDSGGLVEEVDPANERRTVALDPEGLPAGFTDAEGRGAIVVADDQGAFVAFNERTGAAVARRYDQRGNLVFVRHPDGTTEEYSYNSQGLLERLVDRAGRVTRFQHDRMGNCVGARWSDGWELSDFDYLGRRTSYVNNANQKTEWAYDRRSEVIWKKHPDGSEIRVTRDAYRMPVAIDEAGQLTRIEWGGIGWLTRVQELGGRTWDYRYDTEGNLVYLRNPRGQVFRQDFDRGSRCVGVVTFEGIRMRASYDAEGNVSSVETPLGRTNYIRDAHARLKAIELPGATTIALAYRSDGFGTSTESVKIERDYDAMQQIVRDTQANHHSVISWKAGHVSAIVSDVGAPVTYHRGSNNRLDQITVGQTRVGVDRACGADLVSELGAKLVLRRHFDALGNLDRQCVAPLDPSLPLEQQALGKETGSQWIAYKYDPMGVLRCEWRSNGASATYQIDANRQVTARQLSRNGVTVADERITYDPAGSPILLDVAFDTLMRPSRYRNEEFAYDDMGYLSVRHTDAGDWKYEWSASGDLVRVVAPQHTVEMDYDAEGRRIRKRVYRLNEIVSSTSYLWTNNVVLHEVDELSGSTRTYLRDNERWAPLGHVDIRGGVESRYFYVLDPSGALDHAVDENGVVVWDADRSVFGAYQPTVETIEVSVRLLNQHADMDVGLVYNRRRWYDPRVGMFVSPDPELLEGTANPRDYSANPYVVTDPTGLQAGPSGNAAAPGNGQVRPSSPPTAATFDPTGTGLLKPGYNATGGGVNKAGNWVPGYAVVTGDTRTKSTGFPSGVQKQVDAAGKAFGCHSCGAKQSGWSRKDHWTVDHQPPASQVRAAEAAGFTVGEVRGYPHCRKCSLAQSQQAKNMPEADRIQNALRSAALNNATSGINTGPRTGPRT